MIATDGEVGIDGLTPVEAGPLRQKEQLASAAVVGVGDVTFLGHRDGVVVPGLGLRRDIARQILRAPSPVAQPHLRSQERNADN